MAEFTEALFSIFFIETLINGLLLGGVLALLSLGLNLIFGVVDVVWICYAEIIMLGMYTIYFLHKAGVPLPLAVLAGSAPPDLHVPLAQLQFLPEFGIRRSERIRVEQQAHPA